MPDQRATRLPDPFLHDWLRAVVQRMRARPDTEVQQGLIRLAVVAMLFAYFTSDLARLGAEAIGAIQRITLLFGGFALLIVVLALRSRDISPPRRLAAMVVDFGSCSFLLAYTGEVGAPLLVVYLWVTLGNGLRYGTRYLYLAAAMAIAGFLLVIAHSPYWSSHSYLTMAFLLSMVAIPLYAASLIRQLQSAIQRERGASQAKSLFLANMSHEIRTPLTAIIGFSEVLLDVNQTMAERIDGIRTINRAGKHLLGIINDILNLSKIEAGRLEVERLPVPLLGLVDEVTMLARLHAEEKGIDFRVEPVFPLPQTVLTDPVRSKQILLNVISNAVKFTEKGGVVVRVRYAPTTNALEFDIEDTGIGITAGQLDHLFQPFTQADASTTRRFGGTGLGLALSKQLAEMLGGGIRVDSRADSGSRFTVTLDAGSIDRLITRAEAVRPADAAATQEMERVPLCGSVLLAEDNPDNQRLIALKLRQLGIEPEVVENGARAVDAALTQPFDLVILDMQMPEMDGLTAVRTLREHGYVGAVVALTANSFQRDRQRCLDAGFDGFLTKPIDSTSFEAMLRRHLQTQAAEPDDALLPLLSAEHLQEPGMAERVAAFGRLVADHVGALREALAHDNHETFASHARRLRLAQTEYKCPSVVELAGQLEFAATAHNVRAMQERLTRLEHLLQRIWMAEPAALPADEDGDTPLVSELLAEEPDMADLVAYFLSRLPEYAQGLQAALAAEDFPALRKQAHDLKGVGGGYGYPAVHAWAAALEASADAGDAAGAARHVEAFVELVRRMQAGAAPAATATEVYA